MYRCFRHSTFIPIFLILKTIKGQRERVISTRKSEYNLNIRSAESIVQIKLMKITAVLYTILSYQNADLHSNCSTNKI